MILKEENFQEEVLGSSKPVVVDFWAPWCGPCNMMTPAIDRLAENYQDRFVVAKVNVAEEKELADRYKISSIPRFVFFKDGKEVKQLHGVVSERDILDELEKLEDKE